jgi:DAK2 domain fusion protein YloV
VLDALDARSTRRWAVTALADLGQAREEIDALNVFPVPDGDTGTNLYLTVEAAAAAVQALPGGEEGEADLGRWADAFARGALRGARGNSGVILAQLLRGFADVMAERPCFDGSALREALARADEQAWAAVGRPVEGTILSVSRAAAQAAAEGDGGLGAVVGRATRAAEEALRKTTQQLESLRRAGVVDAGGRGLLVLLEALEAVVGERSDRPRQARRRRHPALPAVDLASCEVLAEGGPAYEVMYLLDVTDDHEAVQVRRRLDEIGDSLVVVGGGGLFHVHVHVDDPGAAVEVGIAAGRPHAVRITHFAEQKARHRARRERRSAVGLVAVAAGPGIAELFADAGAVVVEGGPGRRPSTGQLLDAVRDADADAVIVLPNDSDTLAVAEAAASAARQEGVRVSVLPTRAQVQGLAAAAVHDPSRGMDDDLVRMSAAAGAARDGAVTVAARAAITTAGVCRPGDVLGVVDGDFAVIGDDPAAVAVQVTERLISGGGELVTLVTGEGCEQGVVRAVTDHLHRTRRDVEVAVHDGGQPRYSLLIGVE